MKKLVGVAFATVLATSAIFAADPKITMNFRIRPTVVDFTKKTTVPKTGNDSVVKKTNWLDLLGYANITDSFGFKAEGENCGVQFQWNATANEDTNGISALNTYNAWLKFGEFKFSAGTWKDGYADGAYRVKKDHDAASLEGGEFEAVKLGGVFKGTGTNFIDNMVGWNGSNNTTMALLGEYSIQASDSFKINLLAGLIGGKSKDGVFYNGNGKTQTQEEKKDGLEYTTKVLAGPVARVQLNVADVLNSQIIYKSSTAWEHALGLYIMPKFSKKVDLNIGGAIALQTGYEDTTGDFIKFAKNADKEGKDSEVRLHNWEVDLRARIAITDKFSITTMHGIAGAGSVTKNGDANTGLDFGKAVIGFASVKVKKAKVAMWNNLGVRFALNEKIAVGGQVGITSALKPPTNAQGDETYDSAVAFNITPYVQFYASKQAFVNVAVVIGGTSEKGTDASTEKIKQFALKVPVVMRVRL